MFLPLAPVVGATATALGDHGVAGMLASGVPLAAAPFEDKFDSCGGHVLLADRSYHYHGASSCVLEAMDVGLDSFVVGWALDGFAIYVETDAGGALEPRCSDDGPKALFG